MELRVLIFAPRGRDAAVVESVLRPEHGATVCAEPAELLRCLREGSAVPPPRS
jgi:hypothetical protein